MAKRPPITNRVRELREANDNMSQSALAKAIGVTRQTVIAIEQGRYSPSLESAFRKNAYEKFKANIDIRSSAHRATYEAVQKRLENQDPNVRDPFTLGPEAVLKQVIHALESNRPKPRYYITTPTWLFAYLKRVLSTRMLDWVLRRVSDGENQK